MRMEFAEGKDVRYKKRYGKEGTAKKGEAEVVGDTESAAKAHPVDGQTEKRPQKQSDGREEDKKWFRKVDARTIKPGAALAAAPRLTGGIIEGQGKKTTFA